MNGGRVQVDTETPPIQARMGGGFLGMGCLNIAVLSERAIFVSLDQPQTGFNKMVASSSSDLLSKMAC